MFLKVIDLGLIDYLKALELQRSILTQVIDGCSPATLILCQHYSVITLGRKTKANSLKLPQEQILKRNIAVYNVERGGDVTFHSPGQLTAYPIIDLTYLKKDIHWFLRQLEQIVIDSLSDFGLQSQKRNGLTGVWVQDEKIASIGVAIKRWVSFHGLSVNIKALGLEGFSLIRPCGMDIKMTSAEACLINGITIDKFKCKLIENFKRIFGFDSRNGSQLNLSLPLIGENVRAD